MTETAASAATARSAELALQERRGALDRARIRTIVTAAHTDELLDQALAAFDRVGHELGVISG